MGLGSYWGEVLDVLQDIIPIYDKVNSYISLGKDSEHRNKAIKGRIKKGDFVTFLINTQKEAEADAWLKSHGFNPGNISGPGLALYAQLHTK